MEKRIVLVLGAGTWGTALAIHLAKNQHTVYLWDINTTLIESLIADKCNSQHFPNITLSNNIQPILELSQLPEFIENIVIAVPCEALRSTLERIKHFKSQKICLACKGFEPKTQRLNHEIVHEVLDPSIVSVISGPSFAKEVAMGYPTAVTIAAGELEQARYFVELFYSENFRPYASNDLIGVQIGGAVKNVIAIATGVSDGLGYGANARALLITKGMKEITKLGIKLGANPETFLGLSGIGDLILTCTDNQSRNRRFGLAIAKGLSKEQAKKEINQVIEGIQMSLEVSKLAIKHNVDMPITKQVVKIINQESTPEQAANALLSRSLKPE